MSTPRDMKLHPNLAKFADTETHPENDDCAKIGCEPAESVEPTPSPEQFLATWHKYQNGIERTAKEYLIAAMQAYADMISKRDKELIAHLRREGERVDADAGKWMSRAAKAETENENLRAQLDDADAENGRLMDADMMAVTNCEKLRVCRESRQLWKDRAKEAEKELTNRGRELVDEITSLRARIAELERERQWISEPTIADAERVLKKIELCTSIGPELVLLRNFALSCREKLCLICGKPMPKGEENLDYHGHDCDGSYK